MHFIHNHFTYNSNYKNRELKKVFILYAEIKKRYI